MRANTFVGQIIAVLSRRASAFELNSNEPQTFPGRLRALLSRRRRSDTASFTPTGVGKVTAIEKAPDEAPETTDPWDGSALTQQLPSEPPTDPLGASPLSGSSSASGKLGKAVIVMAVAWTVIDWLLAAAATLAYGEDTASGMRVWGLAYSFLSGLLLLVAIAAYVLTGIWLSRARRNADLIAPGQQRRSRVWVWLGWVVPVVSYWYPKQVMDDVWGSIVHGASEPTPDGGGELGSSRI